MALCSIKPELLPIELLHCGSRDFRPFWSRDLDLDPVTFIRELDLYILKTYGKCKYELSTSRLSKVII